MAYRSRKLLDIAHILPCCADFPHRCNGPSVPAHSNQQLFGRGMGFKSRDHYFAAMCPEAHDYVDGRKGGWNREDKHAEWIRAYVKTWDLIWERGLVEVSDTKHH